MSQDRPEDVVTAEELLAGVHEVKTAHPDFGINRVHRELCGKGGKWARLKPARVKKCMQKEGLMMTDPARAGQNASSGSSLISSLAAGEGKNVRTEFKDDDEEELVVTIKAIVFQNHTVGVKAIHKELLSKPKWGDLKIGDLRKTMKKHKLDKEQRESSGDVLEMFTIGAESKSEVQVGDSAAGGSAEAAAAQGEESDQWVAVELDVPGDRSGSKPYQAIISMNKQTCRGDSATRSAAVYKVQTAMGAPPGSPMMCYNQARTQKTFIHPDNPHYDSIYEAVDKKGVRGVNGALGGLKAYFYGDAVAERAGGAVSRRGGGAVVLLNITTVAPPQAW